MRRAIGLFCLTGLLALCLTVAVQAGDASPANRPADLTPDRGIAVQPTVAGSKADYQGTIRAMVCEPTGRWRDDDWNPFHHAFLGYAFVETVNIADGTVWEHSAVYDATAEGFPNIREDNIMAVAAAYNAAGHSQDATGHYAEGQMFTAHDVDAAADCFPGVSGRNRTDIPGFSHTVLIEKTTASWCPNCPTFGVNLNNVYESGDYPYTFVSMVCDTGHTSYMQNYATMVPMINQYNFAYYPTGFLDGGYLVMCGGGWNESQFRGRIEACGTRAAHELDLRTAIEWLGNDQVRVTVKVGNGVAANQPPTTPGAPTGVDELIRGTEGTFTANTVDAEGDDLEYQWSWGDGDTTAWCTPLASGADCIEVHTWDDMGTYDITVRTRDFWGETTDWSPVKSVAVGCCIETRGNVQLQPACIDILQSVDVGDLTNLI
ncbi:MAG: PKD domain-containing protein, partial [candidate division Zixibacteria bacterium]|nr:PKD domain-containing protein [candidate division Zixibacteria bacterium]